MKLLFVLFVLNFGHDDFKFVNESVNGVEIKVWRDNVLIHHHVMKTNDELTVETTGSGLFIETRYIGTYCERSKIVFPQGVKFNLKSGWYEYFIHQEMIDSWTIWGIIFKNPPCLQV